MESRVQKFQKDGESLSKYRDGVQLLREARVDLILLELSAAEPVDTSNPQAEHIAAAAHYERLGYQKCLADLFSLDELAVNSEGKLVADYGAIDKMLSRGEISEEQAETLRRDIHGR